MVLNPSPMCFGGFKLASARDFLKKDTSLLQALRMVYEKAQIDEQESFPPSLPRLMQLLGVEPEQGGSPSSSS